MSGGEHFDGDTPKLRAFLAAFVVNLMPMSMGISVAWTSPASIALKTHPPALGGSEPFSMETISWLGSLSFMGGVVGTLFWGPISERFGRKTSAAIMAAPLIIGWSTVLLSPSPLWILAGRFILGLSTTGGLIVTPLYISEISEESYRGMLSSSLTLFINLGVVSAYFMGWLLSMKYFTLYCGLVPVFYLVCLYFLPETPIYLWSKDRKKDARKSLMWLRNGNTSRVEKELENLASTIGNTSEPQPISSLYENRATSIAVIIGLALFTFQQFNGILMLLSFASEIIEKSQCDLVTPDSSAVIIGIINLLSSYFLSTILLNRFGRKTLLLVSFAGMGAAMFIIGLFFFIGPTSGVLPTWVPFVAISFHVFFYCCGSGPLPYVIATETLRPEIKPLAFSVNIFFGTILSFASVKIYTYLVDLFNMYGCFWFYGIWCIIAIAFTIILIPETKGKSFSEIQRILNGDSVLKNDKVYKEVDISI